MIATSLNYSKISQLSKTDIAYKNLNQDLSPFYNLSPTIEHFEKLIEAKKLQNIDRATLNKVLTAQYQAINKFENRKELIESLLSEDTFTIATAHQPIVCLGPLYFIYKIVSTINLTIELKEQYPAYNFVPFFVIGGEDHDFEEVNHIHIFNKKLVWESNEKGPVGLFGLDSLKEFLGQLKQVLGNSENADYIFQVIEKAYTSFETYFEATQFLIETIFEKYNLLVINMYDDQFKKIFSPIIKDEILHQTSKQLVDQSIQKLENFGYKNQAFPREINFFYIQKGLRERIVFEENLYKVLNTDIQYTEIEIIAEIENHPNHFSPNVIMRPLFQEMILPNLAYIGGGGEIAYWLERKTQFQHYNIPYPILVRRNSVMWVEKDSSKKLHKLGFASIDLFQDIEVLVKDYIIKNTDTNLSLSENKSQLTAIFENIKTIAESIDPTLSSAVVVEMNKQLGVIDQLESRLMRASKQKHDTQVQQIRNLHQKFFPNNGLQERVDNFLPYYLKYGDDFLAYLFQYLKPLTADFLILEAEI